MIRKSAQGGQSLIEVVVAILIAGVVLGAMAIAVVTGLKSSDYAKNQAQATKYVQQTIDQIRTIRDNVGNVSNFLCSSNCPSASTLDCTSATSPCSFQSLFYYQFPPSGPSDYNLNCDSNGCYFKVDTSGPTLALDGITALTPVSVPIPNDPTFSQTIFLTTANSGCNHQIDVTVRVSWVDQSGTHTAENQTVLSDYQQQLNCL